MRPYLPSRFRFARPKDVKALRQGVEEIIDTVRKDGDAALARYAKTFDDFEGPMRVGEAEFEAAKKELPAEIIEKVKEFFGDIPAAVSPRREITSIEPEQGGERRVVLKREAELPYIIIAYHTPNFPHEDSYALDLLSMILSGGKSSRLYQSLVYDQKIALSADSEYSGFNKDPYLFFLSATAVPGIDINEIEKALYGQIEKIITDLPSEREIQKAKNQIESSFVMGQDSIYLQAMKYGIFEMLGDWKLIEKYLEGIRDVKAEDIGKVARKYFTDNNRTVGILIPTKKGNSEQ